MALRRCSTCGLDYPSHMPKCEVCGEDLDFIPLGHLASDWRHSLDLALAASEKVEWKDQKVHDWRLLNLLRAGYSQEHAVRLADSTVDIRRAADLIGSGCPEHLAVEILL